MQQVLTEIQKVFCELKMIWRDFTNCGTRRTLDKAEYSQNLRQISHPETMTAKHDALCSPPLHQLYMSLMGAVAYLAHTTESCPLPTCLA